MMIIKTLSSLEKVFPTQAPQGPDYTSASCFLGELFHYQLSVFMEEGEKNALRLEVDSPIGDCVQLFAVKCVPSMLPAYSESYDDNYITREPGVFPDLLLPVTDTLDVVGKQWRSLWVEVKAPETEGVYPVTIKIGEQSTSFTLTVLPLRLPKQELIFTQWFHCDCIAAYYQVPVFSEAHWAYMGNFMNRAAKYGMNMILTPVLTPPLDTQVGGERPTVQLVDIAVTGEGYHFSYEKLDRFIDMARENGLQYFEISHLFTQWGAEFAPKVVAEKDGALQKLFGWETSATSPEYKQFIRAFLSGLIAHLKGRDLLERCYFHVSDEPSFAHLESYRAALEVVADLYAECNVIDALSDYSFYKEGLVKTPIPANNHIGPFLEAGVQGLWTYYCCAQNVDVSNRFMAMPSARNRITAYQLYKYDIKGFLHWGYNFWFSQYSKGLIDPYSVTDAGEAFPSGDAFSVYPGENGQPLSGIGQVVFGDALQDLRALKLLEALSSKDEVQALIASLGGETLTFNQYPRDPAFLLTMREAVNKRCIELV